VPSSISRTDFPRTSEVGIGSRNRRSESEVGIGNRMTWFRALHGTKERRTPLMEVSATHNERPKRRIEMEVAKPRARHKA
jgi:hypothetical protein